MCQNPDSTGVVFEEALPTTISGKGLQPWVINHHDFHISRYSTLQPTRGLPLASCYFSSFEMARPMFVAGRASNSGLPVRLKSLSFNHERSRPVIQPPQMIKPTPVVGFQTPVIQPLWTHPLGATIGFASWVSLLIVSWAYPVTFCAHSSPILWGDVMLRRLPFPVGGFWEQRRQQIPCTSPSKLGNQATFGEQTPR